jgi:hypothetical protein
MKLINPLYNIRQAMYVYGGSFVSKLADLLAVADVENAAKLIEAFPDIIARYDAMATSAKPDTVTTARYFTDDVAVWRFAPDSKPKTRFIGIPVWDESEFKSLAEFESSPGQTYEIPASEGEP